MISAFSQTGRSHATAILSGKPFSRRAGLGFMASCISLVILSRSLCNNKKESNFLLIVQIGSIIKMCSVASTPLSSVSESQFCEIGLINEKSNLSWKTKSLLPKSYKPD